MQSEILRHSSAPEHAPLRPRSNQSSPRPTSFRSITQALSRDSFQSELIPSLIKELRRKENSDESLKVALAWIAFDNGSSSLQLLAEEFLRRGQETEAFLYFQEAKETSFARDEQYIELCLRLSTLQIKAHNLSGAESLLSEALALNPLSDANFCQLGTLKTLMGQTEVANTAFRKSVQLNPNNDRAWTGLALIHLHKGDFELAIGNGMRALDINPINKVALELTVKQLWDQERWSDSLELLLKYFSKVNFDTDFSILLSHNFIRLNQPELAQLEIDKAICWDPSNATLLKIWNGF